MTRHYGAENRGSAPDLSGIDDFTIARMRKVTIALLEHRRDSVPMELSNSSRYCARTRVLLRRKLGSEFRNVDAATLDAIVAHITRDEP